MTKSQFISTSAIAFAAMIAFGASAQAAKQAAVELTHCDASYGTIAVVEGDTQGWSKFELGSPRELVTAIAQQSGCFEVHSAASATPADFLVNVIAGDKEEVDQGVQAAKGLATDAFVRSGAAGQMLGSVPGAGALMGMFGGLGGKKKVVAAGIRVVRRWLPEPARSKNRPCRLPAAPLGWLAPTRRAMRTPKMAKC